MCLKRLLRTLVPTALLFACAVGAAPAQEIELPDLSDPTARQSAMRATLEWLEGVFDRVETGQAYLVLAPDPLPFLVVDAELFEQSLAIRLEMGEIDAGEARALRQETIDGTPDLLLEAIGRYDALAEAVDTGGDPFAGGGPPSTVAVSDPAMRPRSAGVSSAGGRLTPHLASTHQWVRMPRAACLDRARAGIEDAGLRLLPPTHAFSRGGTSELLYVIVHCFDAGDGRLALDVSVAGDLVALDETVRMRERLTRWMLDGAGSAPPVPASTLEYRVVPGQIIYMNNDLTLRNVNVDQCKARCTELDGRGGRWLCKGFEFTDPDGDGAGSCNLCKLSCAEAGSACMQGDRNYVYYEKP